MANKQDLIAKVAEATELTKKDSAAAVDAVFASIEEFLAAGEKVQLIGFGNFEVRERAARQGRNPVSYTHLDVYKRQGHLNSNQNTPLSTTQTQALISSGKTWKKQKSQKQIKITHCSKTSNH